MVEASKERAAAAATGTLAERPLLHLLVYARNRRLTGKLELHGPNDVSGTIQLWRGRIAGVRTTPPVAYFGMVAYELGHIDSETLDSTLFAIAQTRRLHGEILIERGSLTPAKRDEILAEQACRKIHHLFSLPDEASFAFYEERPAAEEPALTLDPIAPAWRGLCERPLRDNIDLVLSRFAGTTLHIVNEGPLGRAGFATDAAALCTLFATRPMTLAQLRAASSLPAASVDQIAYLLILTKCAEPVPATASGSMPAVTVPKAPDTTMRTMPNTLLTPGQPSTSESGEVRRSLSFRVPSVAGLRAAIGTAETMTVEPTPIFGPADVGPQGIAHRARSIDDGDHFAALGLDEGASVEAARAAYHRLARLWHPDRLPADLAPFSSEVAAIFAHMTRAHVALTDADARREYLASRADGSHGASTKVPLAGRRPKEVVREIEQALARREFLAAETVSRQLVTVAPDNADAHALVAWATTFGGEGDLDLLRSALPLLDKAVNLDAQCVRAHYYRGVLQKRLGSGAAAFRDFTCAVSLDPGHVDAQREIRILEMRARKGSGEHALDVLVSRAKKK